MPVAILAAGRGVQLSSAVSGVASELTAWGDGERVRQILANLLTNAARFTAPAAG